MYDVDDLSLQKYIVRLSYLDSPKYIDFLLNVFRDGKFPINKSEYAMLNMLYYSIYHVSSPKESGLSNPSDFISEIYMRDEVRVLLVKLLENVKETINPNVSSIKNPEKSIIELYCHYSRPEILAAFDYWNWEKYPPQREGVLYIQDKNTDLLLVTLQKDDDYFISSRQYKDYFIDEQHFHWQSQNQISATSPTGLRYINHEKNGSHVLLFVRKISSINNVPVPFTFLGKVSYVEHYGNYPMNLIWRLENKLPVEIFNKFSTQEIPENMKNIPSKSNQQVSEETVHIIDSWEWRKHEDVVVKHVDLSSLKDMEIVIPIELRPYFLVENKKSGYYCPIKLLYNGQSYHARITMSVGKGNRTTPLSRIYWTISLNNIIRNECRKNNNQLSIIFKKDPEDKKSFMFSLERTKYLMDTPDVEIIPEVNVTRNVEIRHDVENVSGEEEVSKSKIDNSIKPIQITESWEWRKVEDVAVKHVDLSSLKYKGTVIPIELRPYFALENKKPGYYRAVKLIYNDQSYHARMTMWAGKVDRTTPLSRIFWATSLSNIIQKEYRNNNKQLSLVFKRNQTDENSFGLLFETRKLATEKLGTNVIPEWKVTQELKEKPEVEITPIIDHSNYYLDEKSSITKYPYHTPNGNPNDWKTAYVISDYKVTTSSDIENFKEVDLANPHHQLLLQNQILRIINIESPISKKIIIQRLKTLNGRLRIREAALKNVEGALDILYQQARIKKEIYCDKEYYYNKNNSIIPRHRDESSYPFEEICLDELRTTVISVVQTEHKLIIDSVIDYSLHTLGYLNIKRQMRIQMEKILIDMRYAQIININSQGWIEINTDYTKVK